jgi:hypothetical protein
MSFDMRVKYATKKLMSEFNETVSDDAFLPDWSKRTFRIVELGVQKTKLVQISF